MTVFTLTLDRAGAGTNISAAAQSATHIATLLNVYAEFTFNDIKLFARPGDDPDRIVSAYWGEMERLRTEKGHA